MTTRDELREAALNSGFAVYNEGADRYLIAIDDLWRLAPIGTVALLDFATALEAALATPDPAPALDVETAWRQLIDDLERGATAPGLVECRDVRASIAAYVRAAYERARLTPSPQPTEIE